MPPPERPLDPAYRIAPFDDARPDAAADVMNLWQREAGLSREEAARRVDQVLLVGTDAERDTIAGVCTAAVQPLARLGMVLWYFRVFVSEEARRGYLAFNLLQEGSDLLEQRYVQGEDQRACGVLLEVENEALMSAKRGRWRSTNFAFVGLSPRDRHLRVRYFPGALAPVPSGN